MPPSTARGNARDVLVVKVVLVLFEPNVPPQAHQDDVLDATLNHQSAETDRDPAEADQVRDLR